MLELHYDLEDARRGAGPRQARRSPGSRAASRARPHPAAAHVPRSAAAARARSPACGAATRGLGAGRSQAAPRVEPLDEIGRLATDFDRMAAELDTRARAPRGARPRRSADRPAQPPGLQGAPRAGAAPRRARAVQRSPSSPSTSTTSSRSTTRWGHAAGDQGAAHARPDAEQAPATERRLRAHRRRRVLPGHAARHRRAGGGDGSSACATQIAALKVGPAGERLTISVGISEFPKHSLEPRGPHAPRRRRDVLGEVLGPRPHLHLLRREHRRAVLGGDGRARQPQRAWSTRSTRWPRRSTPRTATPTPTPSASAATSAELAAAWASPTRRSRRSGPPASCTTSARSASPTPSSRSRRRSPRPSGRTMRRHSELGHDIIAGAGMPEIAEYVLYLHERWDGGGYPSGLAGEGHPAREPRPARRRRARSDDVLARLPLGHARRGGARGARALRRQADGPPRRRRRSSTWSDPGSLEIARTTRAVLDGPRRPRRGLSHSATTTLMERRHFDTCASRVPTAGRGRPYAR